MQHHAYSRPAPGPGSAVVFDCDGVLLTTERAWDLAYEELFAQHGAEITPDQRASLMGLDMESVGLVLATLLRSHAAAATLASRALRLMNDRLEEVIAPMPGAVELVAELGGTRPLAVASNAPTALVRSHLRRFFDLADLVIVGGDMVRAPKPRPDIYLAACQGLDVSPVEAWALEDSVTGATAAMAAGLYVAGVPSSATSTLPCHLPVQSLGDPRLLQALCGQARD
ncbi:HAD family hydrolase [Streptomyces sp. NPDC091027]|uniref:HAD family hydrolase n=1 Tax=Streptomyces sp. NPDC091027 TaxID=3365971 RepID=UPI003821A876